MGANDILCSTFKLISKFPRSPSMPFFSSSAQCFDESSTSDIPFSASFAHCTVYIIMRENLTAALMFGLLLLVVHISDRASIFPVNAPERRISTTAVYTVASGTLAHSTCVIVLHHLGYREVDNTLQQSSQSSVPSCLSFYITAAAVTSQAHPYFTGGYSDAEWNVIKNWSVYAKRWVEELGLKARAVLNQDRVPLRARRIEDERLEL